MVFSPIHWHLPGRLLPPPAGSLVRSSPTHFPPFRYGRRGWRLRLRLPPPSPGFRGGFLPPLLPRSLRSGLLRLMAFRFFHLRRSLPLVSRPPPLPLFPPPLRQRRRIGIRPLLAFAPLLPSRFLPFRRRRGVRRWLVPSLISLERRFRSPLPLYGRRRTPRRLRPLFTLAIIASGSGRLPPLVPGSPAFFGLPPALRLSSRRRSPLSFHAPTG